MTQLRTYAAPLMIGVMLVIAACPDSGETRQPLSDATVDVAQDAGSDRAAFDVTPAHDDGLPSDLPTAPDGQGPAPIEELVVGEGATSLTFNADFAVWAELAHSDDPTCEVDGACFGDGCKAVQRADGSFTCKRLSGGTVWLWDRSQGTKRALDVTSGGIQKDPVLDGTTVIWSERRDGDDFDLYRHDLLTGQTSTLVAELGDQDEPYVCDGRLVWIDRRQPPHGAAEREVWTRDLNATTPARQLTDDAAEQTQPHCSGQRIVWTDYGADGDGIYLPIADPSANNGDIVGYDLTTDAAFVVTDHPSKQIRPAIYESRVVWLDWRGINPEPKYSAFKVYGGELGDDLTVQVELELATSSWQRPSLWQRPTVNADGLAAWVQETPAGQHAVMVAQISVDVMPIELVTLSEAGIEGVQLVGQHLGFVASEMLGFMDLSGFSNRWR